MKTNRERCQSKETGEERIHKNVGVPPRLEDTKEAGPHGSKWRKGNKREITVVRLLRTLSERSWWKGAGRRTIISQWRAQRALGEPRED